MIVIVVVKISSLGVSLMMSPSLGAQLTASPKRPAELWGSLQVAPWILNLGHLCPSRSIYLAAEINPLSFGPLSMLKSPQVGQSNLHASPFTSSRSHTSLTFPHFTRTLLYPHRVSRLEVLAGHRSIHTMMGCLESDYQISVAMQ